MFKGLKKQNKNLPEPFRNLLKYFKNSFYTVGTLGLIAFSSYHAHIYINSTNTVLDLNHKNKMMEDIVPGKQNTSSNPVGTSDDFLEKIKPIIIFEDGKDNISNQLINNINFWDSKADFGNHALAVYNIRDTEPLTEKQIVSKSVDRLEHILGFKNSTEKDYKIRAIERVLKYDTQLDAILTRYPNVNKSFVQSLIINETNSQIIIKDKENPSNYIVNTNKLDTQGLLQIMQDGAFRFFYNALFKKTETDKNGDLITTEYNKPSVCYHNKKLNKRYATQLESLANYINKTANFSSKKVNVNGKEITIDSVLVNPDEHGISLSAGEKLSWENFKGFLHEQYVNKRDYSHLPDVEIGIMYIDSFDRYPEFKNFAHLAAAYNAGPSIISRELAKKNKIVNFPETRKYVEDLSKNLLIFDLSNNLKVNQKKNFDLLSLGHYPNSITLTYD
jgi:hypothetical protein